MNKIAGYTDEMTARLAEMREKTAASGSKQASVFSKLMSAWGAEKRKATGKVFQDWKRRVGTPTAGAAYARLPPKPFSALPPKDRFSSPFSKLKSAWGAEKRKATGKVFKDWERRVGTPTARLSK